MDHHEQHRQQKQKEREHEKKEHVAHERMSAKKGLPVHPRWLAVIGLGLVLIAVLIWTFVVW